MSRIGHEPESTKAQMHAQLRRELVDQGHGAREAMEIAQDMLDEEYGPSVWGGDDALCLQEVYRGRRPTPMSEELARRL